MELATVATIVATQVILVPIGKWAGRALIKGWNQLGTPSEFADKPASANSNMTLAEYIDAYPNLKQVFIVYRHRKDRLDQDDPECAISFAANDREVFKELIVLSGLCDEEVKMHGLYYDRLDSTLTLCNVLPGLTNGDKFSFDLFGTKVPRTNSGSPDISAAA